MNMFRDCTTPEEVVFQAIGAGSVCWETMTGTGVFQDGKARAAGNDAMARLREMGLAI